MDTPTPASDEARARVPGPGSGPGLPAVVGLYALARLALVAAIAGLLILAGTPGLVAVLVGLVVALPLSMFVFRGLRTRLDAALAEAGSRRAAERAALRAGLRGDEPTRSAQAGEAEADRGEGGPAQQQ
jgi:UPF0716 family protein affecting phage T7 exclusion